MGPTYRFSFGTLHRVLMCYNESFRDVFNPGNPIHYNLFCFELSPSLTIFLLKPIFPRSHTLHINYGSKNRLAPASLAALPTGYGGSASLCPLGCHGAQAQLLLACHKEWMVRSLARERRAEDVAAAGRKKDRGD